MGFAVGFYGAIAFLGLPYISGDCKDLIVGVQSNDASKAPRVNLEITDFIFDEDANAHTIATVETELKAMLCKADCEVSVSYRKR